MRIFKLIWVFARNQLILKPCAWGAAKALKREIKSHGFNPKSVQLWIGLADADELTAMVFFRSDSELAAFNTSSLAESVRRHFNEHLLRTRYPHPTSESPGLQVKFFSHEQVKRGGGYFYYFK